MDDGTKKVVVLGCGSWGTALASLLALRGMEVVLWGRDPEAAEGINTERRNPKFLPGVELPEGVRATTAEEELRGARAVLFVVPSKAVRAVAEQMREAGVIGGGAILVSCIKGIELESGSRMTEVIGEIFPENRVGVLSGPNHAEEVAKRLPTAAVVGAEDARVALELQEIFTLPWFRSYTSDDVVGIEWAGAVKNVFAIAAGIVDGLGLGDNAKAALVTRGLAEMVRLGTAFGGKPETFQGLSGVGDLIATCYSAHSRNNRVGLALGRGEKLEEIVASMKMVAEGVPNTVSIHASAKRAGARTPLIDQVYAVLNEGKPALEALSELLARDPRPEVE